MKYIFQPKEMVAVKIVSVFALMLALSGCAKITFTLPYDPQSTAELSGSIQVNDFEYSPKEGVAQNEIRETAAGTVLLTENVGELVANAIRRELRQSGVSLKSDKCTLSGSVEEFLMDSLGYSTDYKTQINYRLYVKGDGEVYNKTYIVMFNASKFVVADVILANLNKVLSDNIKKLIEDSEFEQYLIVHCS